MQSRDGVCRAFSSQWTQRNYFIIIALTIFFIHLKPVNASDVVELKITGAIGPATADYLLRGIAKGQDASAILITLDTPGGLLKSTRQVVKAILSSKAPVIVFVSPSGARAASAGTYLLYASTIAAMAPGTHLGAASPVNLMSAQKSRDEEKKSTMGTKITNDAVAYIRTLAQLRKRNVQFAEKAVLDAQTLTATEAKAEGVIDLLAPNSEELLSQLDGKVVSQDGRNLKMNTKNASIRTIDPGWRMRFLLVITDPTIAYMLLLLGVYGIFFEFVNPGFVAPGVIGAVAMIIALYAMQLLPVNYAGLALIFLGVVFVVAEAYAPSFGALGLGGTAAFIVGSILLMDTEHQSYQIAWSAIWAMAAANVMIFIVLLGMALRSRQKPIRHGASAIIGTEGRSISPIFREGQAVVKGEIWSVYARHPIAVDKPIVIIAVEGLRLEVEEIQGE